MPSSAFMLPDDLLPRLQVLATLAGSPSLEHYVELVLRQHLEHEEERERLLLERLYDATPAVPATPQFWEELRERFAVPPAAEPHRYS